MVIPVEKGMIEERVWQGLFEPAWGPSRNAHFLVLRKNGKYHIIISARSMNQHTLEDACIPPNMEASSEAFPGLPISALTDFRSGYHQRMLLEDHQQKLNFLA